MNFHLSLTKKFSALLLLFAGITVFVLYMMVQAKDEAINFGKQELRGDVYQRPLEKAMAGIARHRVAAQRVLYGEKQYESQLAQIQTSINAAFEDLKRADGEVGEALAFTDEGLAKRKREHFRFGTVTKEWAELQASFMGLKPAESNEKHAHLIADLRVMITHSGDLSNLILDPDLDSYYMMDMTLLALPQAQDRIQNIIIEMEPLIRRKEVTLEERIKASVFAAMMNESDLERLKADFSTVLNEDPNFYGSVDTLKTKWTPEHEKYVNAHKAFIDMVSSYANGQIPTPEQFVSVSDRALDASFAYWDASVDEMDNLLNKRVGILEQAKTKSAIMSILCLLATLGIAVFFMKYLVKNMREIVQILTHSSAEVSNASVHSATSATQLSEASTQQAASLQETMASLEEISAMVGQNAESSSKTKDAVDDNQKVSEDGSRSVDEMMDAIGEIKSTNDDILAQMESSNKEFGNIVKIISEIGEKTNVINEIVFQTKLLSFNASVEAARAGEHGKGFAVVAEEVGNLAQMSGNAAKQITDMLSGSIKKVNEIVEQTKTRVDGFVETGREKIHVGESRAEKCREALGRITSNAQSIAAMIAEIAYASKEQANGIHEINKAITQLDQMTQQNSSVAQQCSTQAEGLNSEAQTLTAAITKLVIFVEGKAPANMTIAKAFTGGNGQGHQPTRGNVSPMKPKSNGNGHSNGVAYKKAAGSDLPPSRDDADWG